MGMNSLARLRAGSWSVVCLDSERHPPDTLRRVAGVRSPSSLPKLQTQTPTPRTPYMPLWWLRKQSLDVMRAGGVLQHLPVLLHLDVSGQQFSLMLPLMPLLLPVHYVVPSLSVSLCRH